MKVKSLIGRHAGQILEVPFNVGENLILQGQAARVADDAPAEEPEVEGAVVEPSERAVARGARKKK